MSSLCSSMYSRNDADHRGGLLASLLGVAGEQDHVLGYLVDGLLVGLPHVEDRVAQLGVRRQRLQRLARSASSRPARRLPRRPRDPPAASAAASWLSGSSASTMPCAIVPRSIPPASFVSSLAVVSGQPLVEARQPAGDGRGEVGILVAEARPASTAPSGSGSACAQAAGSSR